MFYLFLKETQSVGRGGAERETESEAGSRLGAVSTDLHVTFEPTNCEIVT